MMSVVNYIENQKEIHLRRSLREEFVELLTRFEVEYKNAPGLEPKILTGYVASIPVGLDTIGSVQIEDDLKGKTVKRGYTRLGGFLYGGSLDILLFSKGLATGAVQTRMGNQIGVFNVGKTPKVKPKGLKSPETKQ